MNTSSREQRHYSRIPFQTQVRLIGILGIVETALIDISLKGALVQRPVHWVVQNGATMVMELVLADEASMQIQMHTRVAHVVADRMGLHCTDIDLDSATHLRRLVAINLGDPLLLERELAAMG